MNSTVVVLTVLVAALGIAYIIGRLLTLRAGLMKEVTPAEPSAENDNSDLGLSTTGPTVVHFSATWCGPCAAVRRVVDQGPALGRQAAGQLLGVDLVAGAPEGDQGDAAATRGGGHDATVVPGRGAPARRSRVRAWLPRPTPAFTTCSGTTR